jgi:hypothetical protein
MYSDLTTEFLTEAARSDEPAIRKTIGAFEVTVYVRRLESFEIEEPDPIEYRVHPITRNAPLNNKARSVGR